MVYSLTNFPADAASPENLTTLLRGHWGIEERLHLIRDVAWGEDQHRARTANRRPKRLPHLLPEPA